MVILDILGEICTYLGLTMIPWGDSVYILDYHALELGEYYEIYSKGTGDYSFLGSTTWEYGNSIFKAHHLNITIDDFIGGDTSLSLGSTYNKVSVIADLNPIDTILFDEKEEEVFRYSERLDEPGKTYGRNQVFESNSKGTMILTGWEDEEGYEHLQKTIYRFMDLDNSVVKDKGFLRSIRTNWYNLDTKYPHDGTLIGMYGWDSNPYHNTNYEDLYKKVGASYVEYLSEDLGIVDPKNEDYEGIDPKTLKLTGSKTTAIIMSLHNGEMYNSERMDFERQQSGYHNGWWNIYDDKGANIIRTEDFVKQKLLSVSTWPILIGDGDYIFIKGVWKFYANNESFCPVDYWEESEKPHSINAFVWCSLNDGRSNYWDGEKWKPASEFLGPNFAGDEPIRLNPKFKMPYDTSFKSNRYDTDFAITGYADFDLNLDEDEEGYIIPAPPTEQGQAKPISLNFEIYKPWGPTWTSNNVADLALLEDFDIKIVGKKKDIVETSDSNTEYTNILTEEHIEEYPKIDLKISSWDNKILNTSSTYWYDLSPKTMSLTGDTNPISKNVTFWKTQVIGNKATGQLGRPEELIVGSITKQYSTPTASLGVTLFNSLGITPYSTLGYHFMGEKIFVVDGMTIDYAYDTVNLTLIERK